MIELTEKEVIVAKIFAEESLGCCGEFNDDANMSWNNAQDIAKETGWSLQAVGGVMSSLLGKGLIVDSMESARGLPINDFIGCNKAFLQYDELKHLVK